MNNLFSLNEVKVSYSHKTNPMDLPAVSSSKSAYDIIYPSWEDIDYKESFKVLFLNRANRVLGISNMFTGGTSGTFVDVKIIFQTALKCNSVSIIIFHYAKKIFMQSNIYTCQLISNI
jgi:DNA repair protein RadC